MKKYIYSSLTIIVLIVIGLSTNIINKCVNKVIMSWTVSRIDDQRNVVFLTFDDGPEPGVTEFVLDCLDKYNMKGTFFCKGENAKKYPELINEIEHRGHLIANHTYSHFNAYSICSNDYLEDVEKADSILHTPYFRPPNGCLTLLSYFTLKKKYKIIYWSIESGDWCGKDLNVKFWQNKLQQTRPGDIILFHFSKELEQGTRRMLPNYIGWLHHKGYTSKTLKIIAE